MKILELELIGYSRFSLKQINYLNIKPVEKNQMILGTNGSGKSSLIEEASPMPALSSKYSKDGSKYIKIEHRGKIYEMKSVFSPTQRHSFVIDAGENLNQGGTLTAQKELVKQHLGVTQDTHDMLTGLRKLTDMTPLERREWFTRMSDTDYEYAISFYQKLKEKARDLTGAIKLTSARLASETAKLTPDEEIISLSRLVTKLKSSQIEISDERKFLNRPITAVRNRLEDILSETEALHKTITASIRRSSVSTRNSLSDYNLTESLRDEYHGLNARRKLVILEIEKKKKALTELTSADLDNAYNATARISELSEEISTEESRIRLKDLLIEFPSETNISIDALRSPLNDLLHELRHNKDDYFSRDAINDKRSKKESIEKTIVTLERSLDKVTRRLDKQEELKKSTDTECPKCSHRWKIGYDEELTIKLAKEKNSLIETLAGERVTLKAIEEYIEEFTSYTKDMKSVMSYFDKNNSNYLFLDSIWKYSVEEQLIKKEPRSFLKLLDNIYQDNLHRIRILELTKRKKEINDLKERFSGMSSSDISKLSAEVTGLEHEYGELTLRLERLSDNLDDLETHSVSMLDTKKALDKLSLLDDEKSGLLSELVQGLKNDALTKALEKIKVDLSLAEDRERRVLSQRELVKSLSKDLETYKTELATTNKMLKSMSPTDGLIAKGLIGFMDVFMRQMNSFISKIWLYDLKIESCRATENDTVGLSYNFPVSINGKIVSPDVAKTSKGMSEILNLAFRVVAMRYLGLSDYILVLDEFSANMDEAHKKSAFNAINTLMSHSEFEQLYIVSHFYHSYGGMKNADVCVLCDANITIPDGCSANRHVVIK